MTIVATIAAMLLAATTGAPVPDGDAFFHAGEFDAAAVAYAHALQANPKDPAATLGLGTVELYRNHLDRAQALLTTAQSLDPSNPRPTGLLHTLADRRGSADVFRMKLPANAHIVVPFARTDPLPILKVRINGSHDVYFLIDTGAPTVVLDSSFAAELGLKTVALGQGTFAGGKQAPVLGATLPSLELGGLRIDNIPARILATRGFELTGPRIDGIIGTAFLAHFLSTIDYVGGKLVLQPRGTTVSHYRTAVPMWLVGDHFIFARGQLNNGPEGLYNVDTGLAGGGAQATKATIDASHIVLDKAHQSSGVGGGGVVRFIPFRARVTLGAVSVDNVAGIYTPDGDQFGIFPFAVAGTISHDFFRHSRLTFDFTAMKLIIS